MTAVNPQHVYEQEGEYYVTVTGSVTALGNRLTKTSQSAIVRVIQWGQLGLESLEEAFYNNKGLTQVALPDAGAFAKVTTVENMFYNCTLLTAVPVGLIDQCTELTSAASLFSGCSSLTSIPEGFFDKCPKIASLASAFKGCKKVTEIPAGLFDNLNYSRSGGKLRCADESYERVERLLRMFGAADSSVRSVRISDRGDQCGYDLQDLRCVGIDSRGVARSFHEIHQFQRAFQRLRIAG